MGSELKVPLFAGVTAFALSTLVGVVSRVGFGAVMLRALLLGCLFTAAAFGLFRLLKFVMPELFSDATTQEPEPELSASEGSRVDIVLPGDDDEVASGAVRESGRMVSSGGDDIAEELIREVSAISDESLVPEGVEPPPSSAVPRVARPPASFDDLDVLPDLDGFAGSFEGPTGTAGESVEETVSSPGGGLYGGGSSGEGGSSAFAGGVDPSEIAMAVRTILTKDQKG